MCWDSREVLVDVVSWLCKQPLKCVPGPLQSVLNGVREVLQGADRDGLLWGVLGSRRNGRKQERRRKGGGRGGGGGGGGRGGGGGGGGGRGKRKEEKEGMWRGRKEGERKGRIERKREGG